MNISQLIQTIESTINKGWPVNPRAGNTIVRILERPQSSNISTSSTTVHMTKGVGAAYGKKKKDKKNLDKESKAASIAEFYAEMGGDSPAQCS